MIVGDNPLVDEALLDVAKGKGDLDRAARARADRAEILEVVKYRLTQPLAWLFRTERYFEESFESDMASRLRDLPPEAIQTPRTSIAAPILEGISHTIDEPELRELYLNLLASAADKRSAGNAHPAFAHVIDQLAAEESEVLTRILGPSVSGLPFVPAAQVRFHAGESDAQYTVIEHCITPHEAADVDPAEKEELTKRFGVFYVNWQRLGLMKIDFMNWPAPPGAFDWVPGHVLYEKAVRELSRHGRVEFGKGMVRITSFGVQFANTVLPRKGNLEPDAPPTQ